MIRLDTILSLLKDKTTAYQQTFDMDSVHAKAVIKDLAKFCRADASTFHKDARASAVLQGRREVWLRIQNHIHLTPEQILDLKTLD